MQTACQTYHLVSFINHHLLSSSLTHTCTHTSQSQSQARLPPLLQPLRLIMYQRPPQLRQDILPPYPIRIGASSPPPSNLLRTASLSTSQFSPFSSPAICSPWTTILPTNLGPRNRKNRGARYRTNLGKRKRWIDPIRTGTYRLRLSAHDLISSRSKCFMVTEP